jgi:hypothetical protein
LRQKSRKTHSEEFTSRRVAYFYNTFAKRQTSTSWGMGLIRREECNEGEGIGKRELSLESPGIEPLLYDFIQSSPLEILRK